MNIVKEQVISTIDTFPLITAEDLSIAFNVKLNTMKSYLVKLSKEVNSIDTIYIAKTSKTVKYFFNREDIKKVNSTAQNHHAMISKAYCQFAGLCRREEKYDVAYIEKEALIHGEDEYRTDLKMRITNKETKNIITLLIEVETGSKSPADTMQKFEAINKMQGVMNKDTKTLVFQDNNIIQNSTIYLISLLDRYLEEKREINENVFFRTFDFEKKPFEEWFGFDEKERKNISLKQILS